MPVRDSDQGGSGTPGQSPGPSPAQSPGQSADTRRLALVTTTIYVPKCLTAYLENARRRHPIAETALSHGADCVILDLDHHLDHAPIACRHDQLNGGTRFGKHLQNHTDRAVLNRFKKVSRLQRFHGSLRQIVRLR